MGNLKRAERMAVMLLALVREPNKLITLTQFCDRFGSAKSTLSEDITAIKKAVEGEGLGRLETVPGAAGGVKYLPFAQPQSDLAFVLKVCGELSAPERVMPGNFIYTADLFTDPRYIRRLGEIFAGLFVGAHPDVVVTVESKGIPIALMTASALNKPLVIARKTNRVAEGSSVTINYVSTSSKRLQSMSLPRRAVQEGQKAIIIDDFVKGGGTVSGIRDMMKEFCVSVVGIGALVASPENDVGTERGVRPLMILEDVKEGEIDIRPATWLINKGKN